MIKLELPKLKAVELSELPTEYEFIEILRNIQSFLGDMAFLMGATHKYPLADNQQRLGRLMNGIIALKQAEDAFNGQSNLAVPAPGFQQRPQ